jgi:ketosteroid isomerase-like protein
MSMGLGGPRLGTRVDHRVLIDTAMGYYAAGDVDQLITTCSDDIVYQLYICPSASPFGGASRGKDAVKSAFFDVLAIFDCLQFRPVVLDVRDGVARVQTQFVYLHRASGERLSGSMRLVCTIRDDLICRMDEYHDDAMVQAFMRLAAWRVAEDGPMSISDKWKLPS